MTEESRRRVDTGMAASAGAAKATPGSTTTPAIAATQHPSRSGVLARWEHPRSLPRRVEFGGQGAVAGGGAGDRPEPTRRCGRWLEEQTGEGQEGTHCGGDRRSPGEPVPWHAAPSPRVGGGVRC